MNLEYPHIYIEPSSWYDRNKQPYKMEIMFVYLGSPQKWSYRIYGSLEFLVIAGNKIRKNCIGSVLYINYSLNNRKEYMISRNKCQNL
jgi:hypothetical protein